MSIERSFKASGDRSRDSRYNDEGNAAARSSASCRLRAKSRYGDYDSGSDHNRSDCLARHALRRPLAAFLGLWFLLVMIEPESVHSCPVHSAASSAHAAHSSHHAASQDHHSKDASGAQCSCPGDCAASSANALPSAGPILARLATVEFSDRAPRAVSYAPRAPEFFLPFAIGPPATVIA